MGLTVPCVQTVSTGLRRDALSGAPSDYGGHCASPLPRDDTGLGMHIYITKTFTMPELWNHMNRPATSFLNGTESLPLLSPKSFDLSGTCQLNFLMSSAASSSLVNYDVLSHYFHLPEKQV